MHQPKVGEQDGEQERPRRPERVANDRGYYNLYAAGEADAYMNALEAENKLLKAKSVDSLSLGRKQSEAKSVVAGISKVTCRQCAPPIEEK
jgi:hypothetical protein